MNTNTFKWHDDNRWDYEPLHEVEIVAREICDVLKLQKDIQSQSQVE